MKKTITILIFTFLAYCYADELEINSDSIYKGAVETVRLYVKSNVTADEIPDKYWNEAIKKLKPARLYMHFANLFIVLKVKDEIEEGIYIYMPVSSSLPTSTKSITFTKIKDDVYKYRQPLKIHFREVDC